MKFPRKAGSCSKRFKGAYLWVLMRHQGYRNVEQFLLYCQVGEDYALLVKDIVRKGKAHSIQDAYLFLSFILATILSTFSPLRPKPTKQLNHSKYNIIYHQIIHYKYKGMNQNEQPLYIMASEQAKNRLKTILATNTALTRWKKSAAASKNRYNRLKELIKTQEDYYNSLNILQEKIKAPLINNNIVPSKKAAQMFNNLENMIQLSQQMKTDLASRFQKWDRRTTVIGDKMAVFAKFLLVYSDYFKNLNETKRIMKELSLINPQVRELQKNLFNGNQFVTIDDLLMKPFQRSFNYHMILKEYFDKTDRQHPDYEPLKRAIAIFKEVNEKNNDQLEHKEKDQKLIELDARFSHIIDSEARQYISKHSAFLIQVPITMYVFSDMVLLATKGVEKEHSRITLNRYSLIVVSKNEKYFNNGLFLYGQKNCVYLRFETEPKRDEVFIEIRDIIKKIFENEHNRQNIMALRVTRNSTERNSWLSPQDEPQFVRPLICTVVGFERRKVSQEKTNHFFVIQFRATPKDIHFKSPPKQYSFISWDKLLTIQSFILHKYPKIDLFPLKYVPRDLTLERLTEDESLRFELHSINIQIFLNSVFRSHSALKKIDIICKNLDICDSLWRHMGSTYSQLCFCEFCIKEKGFRSYESYEAQVQKRLYLCEQKKNGKLPVQLCEIRTINTQMMITEIPTTQLNKMNSVQRISWVKAKKGLINHSLTNIRPFGPYVNRIDLKVWFFSIKGQESIVIDIHPNSRVKHIVDKIAKILKFDLSDYTLELHMGQAKYLLNEDQIIRNVYVEYHEHQGVISRFFALFSDDDFMQKFYLKKNWVLQPALQLSCTFQKLFHQVQEIICRIKSHQIRMGCEEVYSVTAYYFAFTHYLELQILNSGTIERKRQQLTLLLPPKFREKKFTIQIMQKIKEIQENKRISKEDMLKSILRMVALRPGWSCIMFYALEKSMEGYYIKRVQIGCDLVGMHVINDEGKAVSKYEFKLQDNQWSYQLIGQQMVITTPQRQYFFKGKELWKVRQQIEFYHTYYRNFRRMRP